MKALETGLFALTLVLVPTLGWLVGRAMGRRNWSIAAVVAGSGLVALVPHLFRLVVLAAMDGRAFGDAVLQLAERAAAATEVGFFFLALSVFVTMLGWTSTPATTRPE